MHRFAFPLIAAIVLLTACSPRVTTVLRNNEMVTSTADGKILVFALNQPAPINSVDLGFVKVSDSGFSTRCGLSEVIEKAKIEARKAGGNAIKIIDHKPPTAMGSTCHNIKAKILKVEDVDNLQFETKNDINPDIDYAILYVYRYSGTGSLIGYDLHLGDSIIGRVKNNYKHEFHIKKDGRNTLWAKTEAKAEVPINIEIGKTYYLKCSITMGMMVGRPQLQLLDKETGKLEYQSFNAKHQ